jgi:hypothetical protein
MLHATALAPHSGGLCEGRAPAAAPAAGWSMTTPERSPSGRRPKRVVARRRPFTHIPPTADQLEARGRAHKTPAPHRLEGPVCAPEQLRARACLRTSTAAGRRGDAAQRRTRRRCKAHRTKAVVQQASPALRASCRRIAAPRRVGQHGAPRRGHGAPIGGAAAPTARGRARSRRFRRGHPSPRASAAARVRRGDTCSRRAGCVPHNGGADAAVRAGRQDAASVLQRLARPGARLQSPVSVRLWHHAPPRGRVRRQEPERR